MLLFCLPLLCSSFKGSCHKVTEGLGNVRRINGLKFPWSSIYHAMVYVKALLRITKNYQNLHLVGSIFSRFYSRIKNHSDFLYHFFLVFLVCTNIFCIISSKKSDYCPKIINSRKIFSACWIMSVLNWYFKNQFFSKKSNENEITIDSEYEIIITNMYYL